MTLIQACRAEFKATGGFKKKLNNQATRQKDYILKTIILSK
jgi:hypothetical protein